MFNTTVAKRLGVYATLLIIDGACWYGIIAGVKHLFS
jgi:hypothetical protein